MTQKQKYLLIDGGFLILSLSVSIWSFMSESYATCAIMAIFAIRCIYRIYKTLTGKEIEEDSK
ncbi:hypothetical protein [Staphylococcus sp. 11261D007BR]